MVYKHQRVTLGESLSAIERAGFVHIGTGPLWAAPDGGIDNEVLAVVSVTSKPVVIGIVDHSDASTMCGFARGSSLPAVMSNTGLHRGIFNGRPAVTDGSTIFFYAGSHSGDTVEGIVVRSRANAAVVDPYTGIG